MLLSFFFFLNRGEGVNGEIWKREIIIIKRTLGVNLRQKNSDMAPRNKLVLIWFELN